MTTTAQTRIVRAAIYCRKSVTDGLEQEFNSLDSQRATAEAWQWFVFNCWYQFQIKQTDPFASVA